MLPEAGTGAYLLQVYAVEGQFRWRFGSDALSPEFVGPTL